MSTRGIQSSEFKAKGALTGMLAYAFERSEDRWIQITAMVCVTVTWVTYTLSRTSLKKSTPPAAERPADPQPERSEPA